VKHTIMFPLLLLVFTALLGAQTEDKVLAKIGDLEIREQDFQAAFEQISPLARFNMKNKEEKKRFLENLVREKVYYLAALREKLDEDPEVKRLIENTVQRILSREYFSKRMSKLASPDKEAIERYYSAHKESYVVPESRQIAHVLCLDKESADKAVQTYTKDADFTKLVAAFSKDKLTQSRNGLIGYVQPGAYVPYLGPYEQYRNLVDAAFALEKGTISQPIKTDKGFHIITVQEIKPASYKPLKMVEKDIEQKIVVPAEEVDAYYKQHLTDFTIKERVRAAHVFCRDQQKIAKAKADLEEGSPFDLVVQKYSEDSVSRKKEGILGWVYRQGSLPFLGKAPEISDTLMDMVKGATSEPMKSKKGWHIFRIVDKVAPGVRPRVEVEERIRSIIYRQKQRDEIDNKYERLQQTLDVVIYEENL